MKKIIVSMVSVLLLVLSLVAASEPEEIAEGKKLIESKISCASLTDDQLESIGEYYMEQMHPGEAHKLMDQMHGGEGSAQLNQMHQLMAKRFYCNENTSFGMGMMMGYGSGMMSGLGMMGNAGMMSGYNNKLAGGKTMMGFDNSGYGMMGSTTGWWGIYGILYFLLLIGLVVLVILAIIWLWKKVAGKK